MFPKKPIYICIVGLLTLTLGIISSSFIFPKLEQYLIDKETAMIEGSKTFEMWKKPPFPFKLKVYFFNVTNADRIEKNGEKPELKEIGPYIYDEFRERHVLSIDDHNDTIRYIQRKVYLFNRDESGCRDDHDIVTILNFGVATTAIKINNLAPMVLSLVNSGLPYLFPGLKSLFLTATVKDILFDGLLISCESENVDTICRVLQTQLPPTVRLADNNRDYLLSLFHHVNSTDDGPYDMNRGHQNTQTIKGNIIRYQDADVLSQWHGDWCNRIHGTDLTLNPSSLAYYQNRQSIDIFATDICRSFPVDFDKIEQILNFNVYQFKMKKTFGEVPNDKCFCPLDGECPPLGTMDIEPCVDVPIIISQPHFFNADKTLFEYVNGLQPNENKHNTFITIEPRTGIAISVKIRLQMNVHLVELPEIDLLRNVNDGIFPFVWIEMGADLPTNMLKELEQQFEKLKIFVVIKNILIIGGAIIIVIALVLAMMTDKIACFRKITNNSIDNAEG